MNVSDLQKLLDSVNDFIRNHTVDKESIALLQKQVGLIEQTVMKELGAKNWKEVIGRNFGPKGSAVLKELSNIYNAVQAKVSLYNSKTVTKTDVQRPSADVTMKVQEATKSEPTRMPDPVEVLANIALPCICPEDTGIIREWDCPKHGHVTSTKTNPHITS
jgi:hypothetical protein